MKLPEKYLHILIFLVPLAFILSQCLQIKASGDPRGNRYAGTASCKKCHQEIYTSYLETAHFKASQTANVHTIHGSFARNANIFFINKNLKVVMEKRKDGFYQTAYLNTKAVASHRFDLVFGGIKGESYIYWQSNQPFQLPFSYFVHLNSWSTSPGSGYSANQADYSRAIERGCFECHASFIRETPSSTSTVQRASTYDRSSLVLSIDCERCHGPSAQHVEFHTENPNEKAAKYIVQYKSLSRAQKLDACAVCHSGTKSIMLRSTFGFKPGDTLANFKLSDLIEGSGSNTNLDVHGNQLQLLSGSKCFIKSNLACSSCHNTHVNERGNVMLFTQRCMNCHKIETHNFCKMQGTLSNEALQKNCIKCHMPQQLSQAITVQTSTLSGATPVAVTTHRIAIYPQESQKIMEYLKSSGKRSVSQN